MAIAPRGTYATNAGGPGSATILAGRCKEMRDGEAFEEIGYYVFFERTYRCGTSLRTTATTLLQQ